jgi:hypothetical protein
MVIKDDKKGLYKDGHERPDVVAARIAYIKETRDVFDGCMDHWNGDDMGNVVPPPHGEATHVSVFQ